MCTAFKAWPVLLVAAALGFLAAKGFIMPYVIEEEHKESFMAEGPSPTITVEVFNGSIKVTRSKGREVHARLVKRVEGKDKPDAEKALDKVQVRMEKQEGNRFAFTGKYLAEPFSLGSYGHGVYAELEVPADADVKLITRNAGITVAEIQGEIDVTAANGSVAVKGNQKPVKVKTSNASITITDGRGTLDLATSNASVNIKGQDARLLTKTSNASITFQGTLDGGTIHSLTSSNGSIKVSLPPDSQFHLDATTSNSRVTNEFAEGSASSAKKSKRSSRLETTIGTRPQFTLKLQTSNSSIAVKKGSPTVDTDE